MFQEITIITSTSSGTTIEDGIEYNMHPPPSFLVKAMEKYWADKLISTGVIRLNSIEFYQTLESDELGDNMEGLGELISGSHPYTSTSGNRVFIWCAAKPDTNQSTLLGLDSQYDTVIKISDPVTFTKRIAAALRYKGYSLPLPHIGEVNYNRSDEVNIDVVQSQSWQWHVFQKQEKYAHQNEFRLAFTDTSFKLNSLEPIDLEVGPCSDIIACIQT